MLQHISNVDDFLARWLFNFSAFVFSCSLTWKLLSTYYLNILIWAKSLIITSITKNLHIPQWCYRSKVYCQGKERLPWKAQSFTVFFVQENNAFRPIILNILFMFISCVQVMLWNAGFPNWVWLVMGGGTFWAKWSKTVSVGDDPPVPPTRANPRIWWLFEKS